MPASIRRMSALILLALLAAFAPAASPALAATFTVNSTADDSDANTGDGVCATATSTCTLRAAIEQANASIGADTISFNIPTSDSGYNSSLGVWKILVGSPSSSTLPIITDGSLTIDGTTQPGGRASGPKIELDGSTFAVGGERAIFELTSGNNTIKGLIINRLSAGFLSTGGIGVFINGDTADSNTISGNWIGLNADGATAAGNGFIGVYIISGDNNIIRGNTISANGTITNTGANVVVGIFFDISTTNPADSNLIAGNNIGTNAAGTAVVTGGNPLDGILITNRVTNTIIGGTTAGDRNIIAGHNGTGGSLGARSGIRVQGNGNSGTIIRGNYIGMDLNGSAAVANTNGVTVRNATSAVLIDANIIAGNGNNGVNLEANTASVTDVTVQNNLIGLNASGAALANGRDGIELFNGAANDIGVNTVTIRGNTVSANTVHGIAIGDQNDNGVRFFSNVVAGNTIGTPAGGGVTNTGLLNGQSGIVVFAGQNNTIGGTLTADRNVVAARNTQAAIRLSGSGVSANTVAGNYVGLASDGLTSLLTTQSERAAFGVLVESSSANNIIGPGNVISSNDTGLQISGGTGNSVRGNLIGFGSDGTSGRGNTQFGVWLLNTTSNTLGGSSTGNGNTIGNHGRQGVFIDGTSGSNSLIGNTIRNNTQDGILLNTAGASNATIQNNLLSNNGRDGVRITAATGVKITGTSTSGNTGDGISLQSSANANRAAPTLNATLTVVSGLPAITGTASGCSSPGCVVEIFSGTAIDNGEGPRFLASGTADPTTGAFTIQLNSCDRYLTATARDPVSNNTSPFTNPMVDSVTGCSPATPTLSAGTPATSVGSPRTVTAGTTVYQHTLTNTGGLPGTFSLSASSTPQGWTTQVGPSSVSLNPGVTVTVFVTVTVPLNAIGGQVETTSVTASANSLSDSKSDFSRVTQTFGVNIEPPLSTLFTASASPVNLDYTHTITNTGNGQDTITLSATNATIAGSPSFSFPNGNQCSLAPGAGCTRIVRVTLPANSTGGTFNAIATGGGSATDSVIDTAFTQSVIPSLTTVAQRDGFPSDTLTFVHTLTNIGTQSGTFTPTLTLPNPLDGWVYGFTPNTSFTLNAGQTRTITVTATIPGIATTGAISGTIKTATLQVTASSGALATTNDAGRVLLKPQFTFGAASISPVSAAPLATVVFTHTLQNTSNGNDRYTLVLTPTAGLQNLNFSPPLPISIARGGSAQVVIQAQVKPGTLVGTESIAASVQSLSTPKPAPQTQTDQVTVTGAAVPTLSVSPGARSTNPGAAVTFTYTLTNTGNQSGDFSVPSFSLPTAQVGWNATIQGGTPACLTGLAVGGTCLFTVNVDIPAGAFAGLNRVRATISSITSPSAPAATASANVTVNPLPSMQFAPNRASNANPGSAIAYTHTLTNTGNITDTISFSVSVPTGWSAPAPVTLPNVPPGATRSVVVTVTPPAIVTAGTTGVVTVTATSGTTPNPTAAVVDTTTIAAVDAATLTPANQTAGGTAGAATFFFPTLRNTGSTTLAFDLNVTTAGWTSIVTPTTTVSLVPGATLPITLSVQVPLGTPIGNTNLSTLKVSRSGGTLPVLATGLYTTTTAPIGSLLSPTSNAQSGLPGATLIYTHTVLNTSGRADTFTLRTIATNGWTAIVSPASIFLDPGGSRTVVVRLVVPPGRPAGEQDVSYVEVQSLADPTLSARGTETTTVRRFAAADLAPVQALNITPGQVINFQQSLLNAGNALDTFDIVATDQLGWPLSVTVPAGAQATLLSGSSFPVEVRVTVPAGITRGTDNLITIRAISRFDGTTVTLTHRLRYPTIAVVQQYYARLPLVVRP